MVLRLSGIRRQSSKTFLTVSKYLQLPWDLCEEEIPKPTTGPMVAQSRVVVGGESWPRECLTLTQSDARHSSAASPPTLACCSHSFCKTAGFLSTNNQPFHQSMAARASNVHWRYSQSGPSSKCGPSSLHLNNSQIHFTACLLWEISTMGAFLQIPARQNKWLFWISKVNIANWPAGGN